MVYLARRSHLGQPPQGIFSGQAPLGHHRRASCRQHARLCLFTRAFFRPCFPLVVIFFIAACIRTVSLALTVYLLGRCFFPVQKSGDLPRFRVTNSCLLREGAPGRHRVSRPVAGATNPHSPPLIQSPSQLLRHHSLVTTLLSVHLPRFVLYSTFEGAPSALQVEDWLVDITIQTTSSGGQSANTPPYWPVETSPLLAVSLLGRRNPHRSTTWRTVCPCTRWPRSRAWVALGTASSPRCRRQRC